jgi:hypothetical protein
VGQATEELNCIALIYPTFCLFQDILTKEIIGHGTKREDLYYMDDFSSGRVNTVKHSSSTKEKTYLVMACSVGTPIIQLYEVVISTIIFWSELFRV